MFSLNGVGVADHAHLPPYQFSWLVPAGGGIPYTSVTGRLTTTPGNSAASTVQVVSQGVVVNSVTNILQTITQFTANQPVDPGVLVKVALWGNPTAAVAISGNNYETTQRPRLYVRTPCVSQSLAAFAVRQPADWLLGGTLYSKKRLGKPMAVRRP